MKEFKIYMSPGGNVCVYISRYVCFFFCFFKECSVRKKEQFTDVLTRDISQPNIVR